MRLNLGIENQEEPVTTVETPEEQNEAVLLEVEPEVEGLVAFGEEAEQDAEEDQMISAAMESLNEYAITLESLIDNKSCTNATLDLAYFGIQQQLNILGMNGIPTKGIEEATDITQAHQIALEGLRDVINRLTQLYVLHFKKPWDNLTDLFKGTEAFLTKYSERNKTTEQDFKSKKSEWKDKEHIGHATYLWQHFSNDQGPVKDIVAGIDNEFKVTKYVLVDYQKAIFAELEKAFSLVKNFKVNSGDATKQLVTLFKNIEKLHTPLELFKTEFLTGKKRPYFGVTGFVPVGGTKRNIMSLDGEPFPKLAELASAAYIIPKRGSFSHTVKQITSSDFTELKAPTYKITTEELGKIISQTNEMINLIRNSLKFAESEMGKFSWDVIENIKIEVDDLSAEQQKAVKALMDQVLQYVENLVHAAVLTFPREIKRDMTTIRYSVYLTQRVTSTAR